MLASVVLAGGVSKRFGGDKLLAALDGKPLVRRVVEAHSHVSDSVYLIVNDERREGELTGVVEDLVKDIVVDLPYLRCPGPIKGILTALETLDEDEVLLTPGDVPRIDHGSLKRFVDRCRSAGAGAGSPVWPNGVVETLIMYMKTKSLRSTARVICSLKGPDARPSDILRGSTRTVYVNVKNITDNPLSFSNVNVPDDLVNPKPRGLEDGPLRSDVIVEHDEVPLLRALEGVRAGEFEEASNIYLLEGEQLLKKGILHIALHAFKDSYTCMIKANGDWEKIRAIQERIGCIRRNIDVGRKE